MTIGEIHVGDIGTVLNHTIKDQDDAVVDISSANERKIIFNKPDGTAVVKTGTLTTDGTDGQMYYTTASGDLNLEGNWTRQGKVTFGSNVWYSDIVKFKVYKNLDES